MFPDYMKPELTWMALKYPFWLGMVYLLQPIEDDTQPTLWVDGTHIGVNRKFYTSLPTHLKRAALVHETLHVALEHPFRLEGCDPKKKNLAFDHVVNNVLVDEGFVIGDTWVCDRKYKGWSAEAVYADLVKEPSKSEAKGKHDPDLGDDVHEAPGDTVEKANRQEEIRAAVIRNVEAGSILADSTPGHLRRHADALTSPKLRWQDLLRHFLRKFSMNQFNWNRPDRRYAFHMVVPSLLSRKTGRIVVAIDTSGSIGSEMLSAFAAELLAMQYQTRPNPLTTMYFDTTVYGVKDWDPGGQPVELQFVGGGGTDFRPVFEAVSEMEPPEAVIMFTDMYGTFPKFAPPYPVLWINYGYGDVSAPFGETIHARK